MLTPNQLELLAACIEIGVEGAEAPEEDIAMVEAVVTMIRDLMPVVKENGGAILPLLGPNENLMIDMGLKVLTGEQIEVPAANWPFIYEFAERWSADRQAFDCPGRTH